MISSSSPFASSMPATSWKVTLLSFPVAMRALLLPKARAFPPPACICRMKKIQTPIRSSMGNQETKMDCHMPDSSSGFACILILCCRHELHELGVVGRIGLELPAVFVGAADILSLNRYGGHLVGIDRLDEIAERHILVLLPGACDRC